MDRCGGHVALRGVIVGGGGRSDGAGMLGVWLRHDPSDFGLGPGGSSPVPGRPADNAGAMRTGFSEAWLTDAADDSYDLSWYDRLPEADRPAIAMLRELLRSDPDPIDRHFQFAELEARLYRSRDLYETALNEYDEVCRQHDAEMDGICAAFVAKWEKVPLLETYKQMAVRQQKLKDWSSVVWWTTRGIALYGETPAREEAVEDLIKRRNRAQSKLETLRTTAPTEPGDALTVELARTASVPDPVLSPAEDLEVLVCQTCGSSFERLRVRGRKPLSCPSCRSTNH